VITTGYETKDTSKETLTATAMDSLLLSAYKRIGEGKSLNC
jgi:hypothetical protein